MEVLELNYVAVLVCAVVSMVVGAVWYGPLFGKQWMEVIGINAKDKKAREKKCRKVLGRYTLFSLC